MALVFKIYLVDGLLDVEALVDEHQDVREGKVGNNGQPFRLLDGVVFGLKQPVGFSLLLDV